MQCFLLKVAHQIAALKNTYLFIMHGTIVVLEKYFFEHYVCINIFIILHIFGWNKPRLCLHNFFAGINCLVYYWTKGEYIICNEYLSRTRIASSYFQLGSD